MKKLIFNILFLSVFAIQAQNSKYWQQHVDYKMDVNMNVENYQYSGTQELEYTNNSPDTLHRVFYHLFNNAFQPESEMNARLKSIADPDSRMVINKGTRENPDFESRISKLSPEEIGYLHVTELSQDGEKVDFNEEGTILVVDLANEILPGEKTTFNLKFKGQVPVQIRRSGRNNADGVALSMTQWYPKLAEYDYEGWHADPYIAREFYGVWGDFDVKITIDKNYILGGSGVLQNAEEIGYGYQKEGVQVKKQKGKTLTWHFKAHDVHDFAWAADPEYIHDSMMTKSGVKLHFLYKNDPEVIDAWKKVQPKTAELLEFYNENIGPYPWKQYSVIQGGDGGMEYANCTLITGGKKLSGLYSTTAHELAHSWFQQLLGTNESEHPWMDEGFTTYISTLAKNQIAGKNSENHWQASYRDYYYIVRSGLEQPMTTHSDRYRVNAAYSVAAYDKGAVFLAQLGYIIGPENLAKTLNRYYDEWKFKHPSPNDFIRLAEKVTGAELSWYLNDWTRTTNHIDYGIDSVETSKENTTVNLQRIGLMPMPLDVKVTFADGSTDAYYIPLRIMRWEKPALEDQSRTVLYDWPWAFPNYQFEIPSSKGKVSEIVIDDTGLMADIDRSNNSWSASQASEDFGK
ncbi:peptidase M1 [Christiangramia fulva]|uniref:Peptidase M1 n=1 Tax=Christiangramia fulva TaxID=2126553 RepID=A0A2R3Z3I3_9FLAO|nr:M1 family metallopeptidase [Christiangramia fulva]AVR44824.1 peptidase M1 [Christiangramia fulva]